MTATPSIRKSKPTADEDAQRINCLLDDVSRMASIGLTLRQILREKFEGDIPAFKRWVRSTVDRDWLSCCRYMELERNMAHLRQHGIIRLADAYRLLGIDGGTVEIEGAA